MTANKTKRSEEISLRGMLRFEEKTYFGTGTEISVIGNIFHEGAWQEHPLLRINVFYASGEDEILVNDNYSDFVPYLKPSTKFREFLMGQILQEVRRRCAGEESGGLSMPSRGLVMYAQELRQYDEVNSLVRQAKTAVNRLDAKRPHAESTARAVLSALGVTPNVDMPFRHAD